MSTRVLKSVLLPVSGLGEYPCQSPPLAIRVRAGKWLRSISMRNLWISSSLPLRVAAAEQARPLGASPVVTLNLVQGPGWKRQGAVVGPRAPPPRCVPPRSVPHRAWMLKQVQHDGVRPPRRSRHAPRPNPGRHPELGSGSRVEAAGSGRQVTRASSAVRPPRSVPHRTWMLKQVQHDGVGHAAEQARPFGTSQSSP
jgi:hypothetical protein